MLVFLGRQLFDGHQQEQVFFRTIFSPVCGDLACSLGRGSRGFGVIGSFSGELFATWSYLVLSLWNWFWMF